MAAAVQRKAIEDELQRFTLRVTRRTVPIIFSMMLVQASERRNSAGRPSLLTVRISSNPSRMLFETPGASRSRRWARLRISFSAFAASSSSQVWRVAPEAMPDRLGERLRAVDDKQTRHRWIEAPLDQVVDQCLHHSTVLSCPLHQPKRVLEALAIDPERRHQHEMLTDVDAVDLHHHDVESGQIRTHPFLHARSRQRHEVPRSCRLRHSSPGRRGNIALGKPYGSAQFPRRYVDQHQVHRPLAEPVLRDRTLPARQRQFLAPEVAHAGPLNRHLAGVEADLALGSAPAMAAPAIAAGMVSPASLLGVLFHHGSECLDPGRQTEPIKADRNGVPSFAHSPHSSRRRNDQCCANFLHGVAFLRGFDTPSLPAQGEQRRSSYFNIPRGNSGGTGTTSATGATSNLQYLFSGSTTSIPRSVESKLSDTVSVVDFGADPTGVNDSTTALNNAFATSNADIVTIPCETYKVSGPLYVPASGVVEGDTNYA